MYPLVYLILDNAGSPHVSPGTLQFFVIRSFYCVRLDASSLWLRLHILLGAIFYWILARPRSWRYLSKWRPTTNPEPPSKTRDEIPYKGFFETLCRHDSKGAYRYRTRAGKSRPDVFCHHQKYKSWAATQPKDNYFTLYRDLSEREGRLTYCLIQGIQKRFFYSNNVELSGPAPRLMPLYCI